MLMKWTWDDAKSASNKIKHKLGFDLAVYAFDDPLHITLPDPCEGEERWRTFGQIQHVLILVVHTDPLLDNGRVLKPGRIISARRATSHERRLYEESIYG